MENFVLKREYSVGNDLFVCRIFLSLNTWEKEIVSARENHRQIFFYLEVKSLEIAELIKQTALDDQNILIGRLHGHKTITVIPSRVDGEEPRTLPLTPSNCM